MKKALPLLIPLRPSPHRLLGVTLADGTYVKSRLDALKN